MPTAITGATGQLGRLVINQLKGQVPAARPVENGHSMPPSLVEAP